MPYSLEEEKFILESYFRNGKRAENGEWKYSRNLCVQEFREQFPDNDIDDESLNRHINRIINRFRETGSVCKGKSPGRSTVLSQEVVENVRTSLEQSPTKPLRQLAQQTGLSYGSCHRAVKRKLHLHAYKISVVQELHPLDFEKRIEYCQWFNNNLRNNDVLDISFFSDEAWFYLSGYVNSQNYRIWSANNPHAFHETSLHPVKIGLWIAMSRRRIIGPIFFEETVNANRYQQMLQLFVQELRDDELGHGYFQHDNATAHTAQTTRQYLEQVFPNRTIGFQFWPPRSPDLTPLDYFLFGYLKSKVYRNRLHTIDELREAIVNAVHDITNEQLIKVYENMKRRIDACIDNAGGHFEHQV